MNTQGLRGTHKSPIKVITPLIGFLVRMSSWTHWHDLASICQYGSRLASSSDTSLCNSIGLALCGSHLILAQQAYGLLGSVEGGARPSCRLRWKRPYQLPLTPLLVGASIGLQSIFKEGIFLSLISHSLGFTLFLGSKKEFWWQNVPRGALQLVNLNSRVPSFLMPFRLINSTTPPPPSLPFAIFLSFLLFLEIPLLCLLAFRCFCLLLSIVFSLSSPSVSRKFFSHPYSFYFLFCFVKHLSVHCFEG